MTGPQYGAHSPHTPHSADDKATRASLIVLCPPYVLHVVSNSSTATATVGASDLSPNALEVPLSSVAKYSLRSAPARQSQSYSYRRQTNSAADHQLLPPFVDVDSMGNPILRYIEYIIVYACNIRKYTSIYIKGFSCVPPSPASAARPAATTPSADFLPSKEGSRHSPEWLLLPITSRITSGPPRLASSDRL